LYFEGIGVGVAGAVVGAAGAFVGGAGAGAGAQAVRTIPNIKVILTTAANKECLRERNMPFTSFHDI